MEETTPTAPLTSCLDCRQPVTARYCAHCGQKVGPPQRPFWSLLSEFVAESFALDGRFFRSLLPLVFKPGTLSRHYNEGRRTRYVSPFKLYLMTAFVLFFSFTFEGWVEALRAEAQRGSATPAASEEGTADERERRVPEISAKNISVMNLPTDRPFFRRLKERLELLNKDASIADALASSWLAVLPMTLFILLPILALLILVSLVGHRRYFAESIVFALHVCSFTYLAIFTMRCLRGVDHGELLFWTIPAYFVVAYARTFELTWYSAILRSIVLAAVFVPMLIVGCIASFLYAAGM